MLYFLSITGLKWLFSTNNFKNCKSSLLRVGIGNNTFLPPNKGVNNAKKTFEPYFPNSVDLYLPFFLSNGMQTEKELFPTASNIKSYS